MEYNLPILRKQLVNDFNSSELQELCFQLNVDYEIINGENKLDKARELLTYLKRRNRVEELISYCQQERPQTNWNIIKSAKALNDEFVENVGLTPTITAKYQEARFELYRSVWQTLYALKEAGELLWERVSKENIAHFADRLREARRLVGINEILFDKADYEALMAVMDEFNQFRIGKMRLSQIVTPQQEKNIYPDEARLQIEQNRDIKERYELLLQRVSEQFRTQLNAWTLH